MESPTRRAALAVGVAVLLVTAGCLGGTNPSDGSTSSTPDSTDDTAESCTYNASTAAATETGTWSPNASVDQYPQGVAGNGTLSNASVLANAHFDETANRSTGFSVDWEDPNKDFVRRIVSGPDPSTYYSTFDGTTSGSDTPKTERLYVTGSQHYLQFTGENETLYQVGQNTSYHGSAWTRDDTFGPQSSLERFLARGNYTVNGTVERDGRTFVQLTATEGSPPWTRDSFVTYDGTALVTPEGVVHEVEESFGTGTNGTIEKRYEGSVTLDTDVEWCGSPSWTTDVSHLSLSIVEDGHAVEIRNTGGTALPANTTFSVAGHDEPVVKHRIHPSSDRSGTVTTDARLEPGDIVYVTASVDGSAASFALHESPTRGEYAFGAASVTGGNETVHYRLLTGVTTPEWEE
ncbi:hypothetical protein [Halobacterium rubrum]|uniref:hypothetical protein n=1 Tax=Halobacterium TaxID=2239 RepID=UPI001F1A6498|nr:MULTISPECIES: hypothetical protein [Halobacterium]MDH5020893.1 hypothetical protein [Halobacterium rubrum]